MPVADDNALRLRAAVEGEIERYLTHCRARAIDFVNRHFNSKAAARAHATTARLDIIRHPLNLALALPSLVLRRAASTCEKLGWQRWYALLERVPLPLKTAYERRIDQQVSAELFQLPEGVIPNASPLTQAMLANPGVAAAVAAEPEALGFLRTDEWLRVEVQRGLKEWAAARAQLIDAAGSGVVLATSYLVFRSSGHGMLELGRKIASDRARRQATEHFVFGERIGSLFYSIAPVHPTTQQVVITTVIMFAFVGLLTVVVNLLSDPIQRQFAIQHKQLLHVIDGLEERLLLALRKRLRATGPIPTPLPFEPQTDRMRVLDFEEITGSYSRGGTVKVLAKALAALTLLRVRYVNKVGARFAKWSVVGLGVLLIGGGLLVRKATHFDPYDEPVALLEKGAYPTALARLDWLNKHPGYREQAYYWFLRGRAHCGMARNSDSNAAESCAEAYQKALQRDLSYREDEHLVEDTVMLVRDYNHGKAKKLVLQELGPEAIGELKKATLGAVDRFELVMLLEQIGARSQVPYAEVAKLELDAAESCEDKRRVIEHMLSEGWRDAVPQLKPLQDPKRWKCLQGVLRSTLQRLGTPAR